MRSFGEQQLDVEGLRSGTIRVLGLSPAYAVYPRLGLRLGIVLQELPPSHNLPNGLADYNLALVEGELRLGDRGPLVALLWATERNLVLTSSQYHSESQITLECDLDYSRIEAIEQFRNGGPPVFSIVAWPRVTRAGERLRTAMEHIRFEVPRDDWTTFLEKANFGEYDVVEFRRPPMDREIYKEFREQLAAARTRLANGDYNAVFTAVRTGLERFITNIRDGQQVSLEAMLGATTDVELARNYIAIIKSTKDLCHRVVHKTEASLSVTRSEALFVLRSAESCASLVGDLLAPDR